MASDVLEYLAERVYWYLSNRVYGRARRGGVYIRGDGGKSIILVNLSYKEYYGYVKWVDIDRYVEKRNVYLVWLKRVVVWRRDGEVKELEIKAPSGLVIRTRGRATYSVYYDIINDEEVERELIGVEDYEKVDLGYDVVEPIIRDDLEKLKDLWEVYNKLLDEQLKVLGDLWELKKKVVLVHKGCGGVLRLERTEKSTAVIGVTAPAGAKTLYFVCTRCGKTLTGIKMCTESYDEDKGRMVPSCFTLYPSESEFRRELDVLPETRKKYEELSRKYDELGQEMRELKKEIDKIKNRIEKVEKEHALRIAMRLGLRVVKVSGKQVYYNDGTRFFIGDRTTEAHFDPSPLFEAVKHADKIWYYVYKDYAEQKGIQETG